MQSLKGDRNVLISLSYALLNETDGAICHMVSNQANIWQFKLCPLGHFYILCLAVLHMLKHSAQALREGKQEKHSFLWK